VRLPDGRTGWVKTAYLTTREPASVRIKQLQDELDRNRATTPALAEAAERSEVARLTRELAARQAGAMTPADPAAPSMPAAAAAAGMRKVEVADPQYQMTAYTVEIPASWKFAGTIARAQGCHANGAAVKFTAQSADGLSAVVVMPGAACGTTIFLKIEAPLAPRS